ncbi:hypothetical protein ACFTAO_09985 [Paenibacillus rhizoplanae]
MSGANRLMFYIRKLPVLGKQIPASVYSETTLKRSLSVIVHILKLLMAFVTKFTYLGIMIFLPVKLIGQDLSLTLPVQYQLYLQMLLCISFLTSGISSAVILEPKRDKYIFVKLMRLPAERYMRTTLTLRGISFLVTFIPAMLVFGSFSRGSAVAWGGSDAAADVLAYGLRGAASVCV